MRKHKYTKAERAEWLRVAASLAYQSELGCMLSDAREALGFDLGIIPTGDLRYDVILGMPREEKIVALYELADKWEAE